MSVCQETVLLCSWTQRNSNSFRSKCWASKTEDKGLLDKGNSKCHLCFQATTYNAENYFMPIMSVTEEHYIIHSYIQIKLNSFKPVHVNNQHSLQ